MRLLGNIIWFVLAGLWMAIGYFVAAVVMFILIITIPFGLQALKLGVFALSPFGREIVPIDQVADASQAVVIGGR